VSPVVNPFSTLTMARGVVEEQDPLTLAAAPPKDETPAQRIVREKAEMEARKISDEIDEQIKREKQATKRRKRPVKVLLLGQSESGTSKEAICVLEC
jgi:guanine nucleotide-binding protein alpha-1 subunit